MLLLSYAIKITVSTFLIYLSIAIADSGNYRNKIQNAFVAAVILSVAGMSPLFFIGGLIIWIYILINWYSIGFFRSFLCVIIYAVLFFILNMVLAVMLLGGSALYGVVGGNDALGNIGQAIQGGMNRWVISLPKVWRERLGWKEIAGKKILLQPKKTIILRNGSRLDGHILMYGKKGLIFDIADGKSEVLVRDEDIERIEEKSGAVARE